MGQQGQLSVQKVLRLSSRNFNGLLWIFHVSYTLSLKEFYFILWGISKSNTMKRMN